MLKILVPTDYSPAAKNACLYAYHFAVYTNSSIVLYHAMPASVPTTDIPYENYYLNEFEEKNLLEDAYKSLLKKHHLDPDLVEYQSVISTHNLVTQGIKEAYESQQCDMVIMGTHGASGLKAVFIGSNTAQFISEVKVPIIVVPKDYKFKSIYHFIYASDLKNLEEELGVIVPFANVFHAALEIFYFDYAGPESEKLILDAQQFIFEHEYKNIKINIKKGNIHLSIVENLNKHINPGNTQMLIMCRAEHSWLDKVLLGSNSQKMVLEAGLPILVLHKSVKTN
jgi:nucleotide-binding universal stress UspA family protein